MEISPEEMYRVEERGAAMGFPKRLMMENAGAAVARLLDAELGGARSRGVTVLAGLGNNGGDGLVAARHLAGRGAAVTVMLMGGPGSIRTEESRPNWSLLERMPSVRLGRGAPPAGGPRPDAVIDAMLGTGISGGVREPHAAAISWANGAGCPVLAVDVPSGMDPGTGEAPGPCVRASLTVTFHRMKSGLPRRPDLTGRVEVEPIGIPPEAEGGAA